MSIPDPVNVPSSRLQESDIFADEDNLSPTELEDEGSQGRGYSAQMDELFEGVDPDSMLEGTEDDEDEEEFMYNGVDSATSADYHERLREVLGPDMDHEDGLSNEVLESETSLVHDEYPDSPHAEDVTMHHFNEESSPTASLTGLLTPESRTSSHESLASNHKLSIPFLHPTVSRLRSFTPQSSKLGSNGSSVTSHSHFFEGMSPSLSHISSLSHLSSAYHSRTSSREVNVQTEPEQGTQTRQVFKWTELQSVTRTLFSRASQKASNVLGAPLLGSPTTLASNGLICIGTTEGKVVVHDFNQSLVCVCQSQSMGITLGPVTALALSHDQTFVASGHTSGYIQLYNLKQPNNPVRTVPPTTLAAVASGRKEGHLQGSRIVSIGFIAGRHTALVSADEHGLAFFHSLGKILFVEAPDILRILGRYPDPSSLNPPSSKLKAPLESSSVPTFSPVTVSQRKRRSRYTVLAMAPLPLGTLPSPTDNYQAVSLLTPTKLVVVGLRPTPRTWFKCPREVDEGGSWKSTSKWVGSLAWFPATSRSGAVPSGSPRPENMADLTMPLLAYSWGTSLHFISVSEKQIKQTIKHSKTGKPSEIEIGTITYERVGQWSSDEDILAIQWLNHYQLIVTTRGTLGVYDLKVSRLVEKVGFDGLSLITPSTDESKGREETMVAHSIRSYKGRIFLLKRDRLLVGTLLTWADLILSLVEEGDFLKAIDLARAYYTGEAPGNRNNLPDDATQRKYVIGDKLRSLMDSSAQYAFSEERMTDNTHTTPDNRGVDRTSLFEGLVTICCSASIALDDFEFLFEDLFQKYDDSGIAPIYLRQLEPFILENKIRHVPPRITQRLVALHEQDSRPDYVERIIWHMDPSCLDINQAIHLCQKYHLYDALIFIYTRAMRDYVAPVVELLGLIRQVRRFRKSKKEYLNRTGSVLDTDSSMESIIINSYKIYPYLANVLSGLAYPSEEPLDQEEAQQAKRDVYTFVFFGRSSVWPPGDGGKLVLTSDEDGGIEPTYPYVRQLLLFDSESFLHSLDIAFEDVYLNDESQTINRSIILRLLLEILSSGHLPQQDITMVNIFIARNVPKYPQFLQVNPSTLHKVLIDLAQDPDHKTREDRQLAAEYLLSVYNPHDSEHIVTLFELAGFYRILRSWHYHERRWSKLLSTYVDDPDISSLELLGQIESVIQTATRHTGAVSGDLIAIVSDSLPRLLHADIPGTALLINKIAPDLHFKSLELLGDQDHADQDRYEYLHSLLFLRSEDHHTTGPRITAASATLSSDLYKNFFDLQCRFHPDEVIPSLRHLPKEKLDLEQIMETCEYRGVYDAVVWATNWCGDPRRALSKADKFQQRITHDLLDAITTHPDPSKIKWQLQSLQTIAQVSRDICIENSKSLATDIPLEDMWFELLNGEIRSVQIISSSGSTSPSSDDDRDDQNADHLEHLDTIVSSLRSLVQTTFSSLVSITSTSAISFPQLFKRLVNATPSATGSHYKEFRVILTGMLESYRSDEDLLIMLKHLIDRDLFETISQVTRERAYGWAPLRGSCSYCRQPLSKSLSRNKDSELKTNVVHPIVVTRDGLIFHENCRPPAVASAVEV